MRCFDLLTLKQLLLRDRTHWRNDLNQRLLELWLTHYALRIYYFHSNPTVVLAHRLKVQGQLQLLALSLPRAQPYRLKRTQTSTTKLIAARTTVYPRIKFQAATLR